MKLPFLDRDREMGRIARALDRSQDSLLCLYGRRRLGKSRLLHETLARRTAVLYVGDEQDAPLQMAALAREMAAVLPGFDAVTYPGWDALLARWWKEAPPGAVLALDEFPAMAAASPALPGILQKLVDGESGKARKTILCGSAQRMMQGLVLDGSAPLYGRAEEIIKVEPLGLGCLRDAFRLKDPAEVVESHAVWGGVPRYWELALDQATRASAIENLLLDPMGVLHREPERLLADDLQERARASSILALIGQGCHRVSEIGARLGQPATALSRPLSRLMELGFIAREIPFGRSARDAKRSFYRIRDPLLGFWYRFVEPNRSRLAAGQTARVWEEIEAGWSQHLGRVWEDLARGSVARIEIHGETWSPAGRWWGRGPDGSPREIDIVAASARSPDRLLVGEVKLRCSPGEAERLISDLERVARLVPEFQRKKITCALWILRGRSRPAGRNILTARDVVEASP